MCAASNQQPPRQDRQAVLAASVHGLFCQLTEGSGVSSEAASASTSLYQGWVWRSGEELSASPAASPQISSQALMRRPSR